MANSNPANKPKEPVSFIDEPKDGSWPLINPRWELYSQFRALTGCSVKEAYLQAGGKAEGEKARRQGAKISQQPLVKARIEYLKGKQADTIIDEKIMTRRRVLDELLVNMEIGRNVKGGLTASNRAIELIGGEEHGMFVQKRENRTGKIDELDGLEPEQLIAYIKKAVARIPGLEIDAESLAAAVGIGSQPALGDPGTSGDSEADPGSEVSESQSL